MNVIKRIEITHHQQPLEPPFPAAWDTQPRELFPATIVRVVDSAGRQGIGSGDVLYGFEDFRQLFIGTDPLDLERHAKVIDNIGFHAGRCWPLEAALWDLAGKIREEPVWKMLGGKSDRLRAYASTGTHRATDELVSSLENIRNAGFPAIKLRFGRARIEDDMQALAVARKVLGPDFTLMVDCNQGWRMPWDIQPAWNLAKARAVSEELIHHNVLWMEEPLHRGNYPDMAELNALTGEHLKMAGGEMTRESYEFREMLRQDCLDVYQPDVVCSMGLYGLSHMAREITDAGKWFTPHTWGNGLGLMANLHLTAGVVGSEGCPYLEYPFDPPEWTPTERDFFLTSSVTADANGWLVLGDQPGFGIDLDEEKLAKTIAHRATYA